MCGIAGYFTPQRRGDVAAVRTMCDQIRHRGPDDEGYHADAGCVIGMRRLSIIDLSTGHQPISNEDRSLWVVFNGEIYNYQELRADLASRGHRFTTHSDTEVLTHLYEEYGVEGIASAAGHVRVCASGTRAGVSSCSPATGSAKSRCTTRLLPEGLYFGSELKCLRAAGIPLDLDLGSAPPILPVLLHPRSADAVPTSQEARARRLAAVLGNGRDPPRPLLETPRRPRSAPPPATRERRLTAGSSKSSTNPSAFA